MPVEEQEGRDISQYEITRFPLISIVTPTNPGRSGKDKLFCLWIVAIVITSNRVKSASFNILCVQADAHGTAQHNICKRASNYPECLHKHRRLDVTEVSSDVTVSVSSHSLVLTQDVDI